MYMYYIITLWSEHKKYITTWMKRRATQTGRSNLIRIHSMAMFWNKTGITHWRKTRVYDQKLIHVELLILNANERGIIRENDVAFNAAKVPWKNL